MGEQPTSDMHKHYFLSLVTMLSMSAMQQLGKIKNPATGKTEVHLDAAQSTIDMLDMLEAKTAGNLDEDEAKLLGDTLSMLKLNYVETAETEGTKKKETPAGEGQKTAEQPGSTTEVEAAPQPSAGEKKDPKFHKSYGDGG